MKSRILFVERKLHESFSLERVFRQVAQALDKERFEYSFQQMPFISSFGGMLKNIAKFRPEAADVYHVTGHVHYIALFLPARKTVLTIHDLNILQTRKGLRRALLKKILLDLPIRRLKYITAISEATKNEIINFTGCASDKIRVIENPVNENYFSVPTKEFNEECPNILQIGTAPHKNVPNLIKALEGINCRLTIIGKIDEQLSDLLAEKKISFENKYNLDDAAILEEYRKADIIAFCSLYEGFGLPVIEGQAMRIPVVTSDIEPLKGVAGEGAFLVNPHEISAIRTGILEIINDKVLRENLVQKGLENVERFRPETIAAKYADLYKEILSK